MSSRGIPALISVAIVLSLSACSWSALEGSWRDPSLSPGQLEKTVVIAVAREPANRALFEDEMTAAIAKLGGAAEASHPFLGADTLSSEADALELLHEHGADSVLVARVDEQRTERTTASRSATGYTASDSQAWREATRHRGWYGHYVSSNVVYRHPELAKYEVMVIEGALDKDEVF